MRNTFTYCTAVIVCIVFFNSGFLTAQIIQTSNKENSEALRTQKRVESYLKLKKMGYEEKEIFEDLGNANFLSENYDNALFWYDKLKGYSPNGQLSSNYQKRYRYALRKAMGIEVSSMPEHQDWLTMMKSDYQLERNPFENSSQDYVAENRKSRNMSLKTEYFSNKQSRDKKKNYPLNLQKLNPENVYDSPIALTSDGNTAYFSKAVYQKPLHGIFSKKELVHKIYQARKVKGEWKNIKEVALCPKYFSALHPTVSHDGKRLFFASNMPGSLGDYDIYVAKVSSDGHLGIAKNLGKKVNTEKNDLYPNLVDQNTLVFASEGRQGQGGLDVFMVQVERNNVGLAVNLGSQINSKEDDFSIGFKSNDGMGYVMSNRGKTKESVHQVAFSFGNERNKKYLDKREFDLAKVLNSNSDVDYTTSVYEDD
ncbi:PD40 domain-containing protein [Maribacter sp. HTCC2170]|uniref:PD40 domain-containing protein n=1 Tax=Maribacter sp. (strain HTCC2170 / KCCM 42371) TaxID=313603 RepID=UPI00006B48CB|nr:PD40 domain-containing protein [Maribacter sp. HTCC2170]EAR01854.1 OmpA family protein [Maribacter sp. HTCC2170]